MKARIMEKWFMIFYAEISWNQRMHSLHLYCLLRPQCWNYGNSLSRLCRNYSVKSPFYSRLIWRKNLEAHSAKLPERKPEILWLCFFFFFQKISWKQRTHFIFNFFSLFIPITNSKCKLISRKLSNFRKFSHNMLIS